MIKPLKKIWMNGKFVNWKSATVHVMTHALHYGTAIFEGMRCYDTKYGPAVFRMTDHYRRLLEGTKVYQFDVKYSLAQLTQATKKLIKINKLKTGYLRPLCYADYGTFGLNLQHAPFGFAIVPISLGKYYGKKAEQGISCQISSWERINTLVLSPHVKASANYLNSALAKREAVNAGYDEAILLSEEGHVSEASAENIFIVKNGELITPPLSDGILAGITRDSVIAIARELGYSVKERSLLRDDLYTADEVFLCGTAAEITPVRSIDKRIIGNGKNTKQTKKASNTATSITKDIRDSFFTITSGKDDR
ncbi:branched-chain amino acid transaminase, partial [Candidatus Micrarchaeota archaeon]|nr:branched-chain amino acid transaminase [Candidatus Micrarchaeota archaeon]